MRFKPAEPIETGMLVLQPELAEVARRAENLYRTRLRYELEPKYNGEFVAIEPESGTYYLGKTPTEAIESARLACPTNLTHTRRIGYPYAFEVG
jgi:hypothetical protein